MPRTSTKKDKSIYQVTREELGLSREKASELLETIQPERLERIENAKYDVRPDEVLLMAEKYQAPHLCNYYCANECAIGRQYVPEVEVKDLAQIVLEMLSSLNSIQKKQERLIEITADGQIGKSEIEDFVDIQKQLEKISITVEAMQLWSEKMLASGAIDKDEYEAAMKNQSNS